MAVKARQTAQMIVLETPEIVGAINAWATKSNRAKSDLLRDALLGRGWPAVRQELEGEYGRLSDTDLRYGILTALPPAERAAYAERHQLDWNDPRCQVSTTGRGRPPITPGRKSTKRTSPRRRRAE